MINMRLAISVGMLLCGALTGLSACALHSAPIGTWDIVEGDLGLPDLKKGKWLAILPKGKLSGAKVVSATGAVLRLRKAKEPFAGCE